MFKLSEADAKGIYKETMFEWGYREFHPLKRLMLVRSLPLEKKSTGGVWLAPDATEFYKGAMHRKIIKYLVLQCGPKVKDVKPGSLICAQRQYMTFLKKMHDGTMVGTLDEAQILGYPESKDTYFGM